MPKKPKTARRKHADLSVRVVSLEAEHDRLLARVDALERTVVRLLMDVNSMPQPAGVLPEWAAGRQSPVVVSGPARVCK